MTAHRGVDIQRELAVTLAEIRAQLAEVEKTAEQMGVSPHTIRDASGNYIMVPLLAAKAQTLHALVLVNQKR